AAISCKRAHLITPPAEKFAFLVMNSQCVPQADFTQLLKRGAFAIGTHDGATPQICILNVDIFRLEVEIPAYYNIARLFFRDALSQAAIPMQFVLVGWRTDRLAVWR